MNTDLDARIAALDAAEPDVGKACPPAIASAYSAGWYNGRAAARNLARELIDERQRLLGLLSECQERLEKPDHYKKFSPPGPFCQCPDCLLVAAIYKLKEGTP